MRGQEFPDILLYLPRIMKRTDVLGQKAGVTGVPSIQPHPASHRIRSGRIQNIFLIELPHDSMTGYLAQKKQVDDLPERDSCTARVISAHVTIAKKWEQPRCPSTDKWMKKM